MNKCNQLCGLQYNGKCLSGDPHLSGTNTKYCSYLKRSPYYIKQDIEIEWKSSAGLIFYKFQLKAGLRCIMIDRQFVLDEFPADQFPENSIQLHDASHYGIVIDNDYIAERLK